MKVLSLLQPWATLVVIGAKKIETRSWNTKFRGTILIHASKKMTATQWDLCIEEPFRTALDKIKNLPTGAIIGKVDIAGTIETQTIIECYEAGIPLKERKGYNVEDWNKEFLFGDYSAGRYGWLLKNPVAFSHQIPFKGSLGLWDFDERICLGCGCTEMNCVKCIEKTGQPCYWVEDNLCSACLQDAPNLGIEKDALIR